MTKRERGQENGECLIRDRKVFKLMRPLCSHVTIAMVTFQRHQAHKRSQVLCDQHSARLGYKRTS